MSLMNLLFDFAYAAGNQSSQQQAPPGATAIALLAQFIPLILMFVVLYLLIIVPQRRREKQFREMINSLIVGDEIVTNAGIIGKIVNIKDDILTIEVGADRVKLKIYKWAVKEVLKKAEPKD
ncbi:preprotein translocase, YajC subunit [Caldicellulosiruptor kronotskyensis 2002]|uniref:Preprotein translocase, YajC subunit n=1 Tax=Caldicellulosiruptor kronotskyensis (strain DSM 18902 / VKM B-2412 / 2002) TaxID=632348 RepID=E4SH54_CALK2|nr:preprotein translocase subunit YajC [Caldicellulosiruptor kronotskyensis]ADQ47079.1 preprotein translocase, YajC subunit [Caldicellulosiruptor kronotskyensis 2002]